MLFRSEKEGIVADDTEVEEEYNKLAEQYGMPVEKVKELIAKDDLAKDVAVEKAMEFVKESAIAE